MRRGVLLAVIAASVIVSASAVAGADATRPDEPGLQQRLQRPSVMHPEITKNDTGLDVYRRRALHLRNSFWSGLSLYRGVVKTNLGSFGGNFKEVFAGSPAALDTMGTYRLLRIGGFITYGLGTIVLATTLALFITNHEAVIGTDFFGDREVRPTFWALLVPSLVGVSAGGTMLGYSMGLLSRATQQYNSDLYQLLRRMGGRPRALGPAPRAYGVTLRARF